MKDARACQPGTNKAEKRKTESSVKNPKERKISSMFSKK